MSIVPLVSEINKYNELNFSTCVVIILASLIFKYPDVDCTVGVRNLDLQVLLVYTKMNVVRKMKLFFKITIFKSKGVHTMRNISTLIIPRRLFIYCNVSIRINGICFTVIVIPIIPCCFDVYSHSGVIVNEKARYMDHRYKIVE